MTKKKTPPPVKKAVPKPITRTAKEIALEAAIRIKPSDYATTGYNSLGQVTQIPIQYDVIAQAEKIYQWLIK